MATDRDEQQGLSRRSILTGSAAFLAGGAASLLVPGLVPSASAAVDAPAAAPPLPWKWAKLDPLETGRRAYGFYDKKGGCGSASYLSLVTMLREKVGHPWTTLPDMMMLHAGAGYGGHGTLCGALGGCSLVIGLVAYNEKSAIMQQLVDRLFYWYAEQEFPTNRFDDLSPYPKQVKAKAMSPLCHTSVSKWTLAAGVKVTSKEKKDRCSKVVGETVFTVVTALNEYFDGKWTPPVWKPSAEAAHCIKCHGPDNMEQTGEGMNHQQGHMECRMCHADHTK
jgi:hypothetical protein